MNSSRLRPAMMKRPISKWAIASMVLGVSSLGCIVAEMILPLYGIPPPTDPLIFPVDIAIAIGGFLAAIIGSFCGLVALFTIGKPSRLIQGRAMAVIGLVSGSPIILLGAWLIIGQMLGIIHD